MHRRSGWRVRLLTRPGPNAGPSEDEVRPFTCSLCTDNIPSGACRYLNRHSCQAFIDRLRASTDQECMAAGLKVLPGGSGPHQPKHSAVQKRRRSEQNTVSAFLCRAAVPLWQPLLRQGRGEHVPRYAQGTPACCSCSMQASCTQVHQSLSC